MSTPSTALKGTGSPPAAGHSGQPIRPARWWLLPATVVTVLGAFTIYSAWVAHQGVGEASGAPYLSPFYSPTWLAARVPLFPALLCLIVPLSFRGTCYYYRKAYWRSFFWDPPACAVGEPRHKAYKGETRFPFILNNMHRFTMYLAVAYMAILGYDMVNAFSFGGHLYLGLGTGIMVLNVVLLAGYTFGCHALRHFVGGGIDCYSCVRFGKSRKRLWRGVSMLTKHHARWAWVSMLSVTFVDIYIRVLNAGWFTDPHITF